MAKVKKDLGIGDEGRGHQPSEKGHQPNPDELGYKPTTGNIDTTKPPQGGSGVPSDSSNRGRKNRDSRTQLF